MIKKFDILLKNARVIDGTGNPYYLADIGLSGRRIARIERRIHADADRIVDAKGLVVSPGFLDVHTHDDMYLMVKPTGDDKILQGVTTIVVGNCGFSVGPISDDHRTEIMAFLQVAGAKYLNEKDTNINSLDDYLKKLEALKPGINVMSLVGHSSIRVAVMGVDNRLPTTAELARMKELVAESMRAGACGLSSGLIYAPGNFADIAELTELAKAVAPFNGLYTTHLRSEGDVEFEAIREAIKIGEDAGIPTHISHHKIAGKQNWGNSVETLNMIAEARERGIQITCDQYPYRAGSTFLAAALPPSVLAGGYEAFAERMENPEFRAGIIETIENDTEKGWQNMIKDAGFDGIVVASAPQHKSYAGKSLTHIAEKENKSPYDVLFDTVMVEQHRAIAILFMIGDEDIERIMKSPFTMTGSDGIPGFGKENQHPRQAGTFPKVLGRYAREKGVLSLEEAIRKMTSFPAQTFGLKRKGLLKEGFDADIVVFDPETIIDRATYEDSYAVPEGISFVLVNGQVAMENGRITGANSGTVLKRGINT